MIQIALVLSVVFKSCDLRKTQLLVQIVLLTWFNCKQSTRISSFLLTAHFEANLVLRLARKLFWSLSSMPLSIVHESGTKKQTIINWFLFRKDKIIHYQNSPVSVQTWRESIVNRIAGSSPLGSSAIRIVSTLFTGKARGISVGTPSTGETT